jgi:polysaccharide deacetylase 2 family uncharacterized protein YibQ
MSNTLTPEQIRASHIIDDLGKANDTMTQALIHVKYLLSVAVEAHENHRHDVTAEYIDRALTAATAARNTTRRTV